MITKKYTAWDREQADRIASDYEKRGWRVTVSRYHNQGWEYRTGYVVTARWVR